MKIKTIVWVSLGVTLLVIGLTGGLRGLSHIDRYPACPGNGSISPKAPIC